MENSQGNNPLVPKSDMEIIMPYANEMVAKFADMQVEMSKTNAQMQIEMNKTNVDSNEKVRMQGMNYKFKEALMIYGIITIIAVIGGVSGLTMLHLGKTDIGSSIIFSTITGILGFFGGKSLAAK